MELQHQCGEFNVLATAEGVKQGLFGRLSLIWAAYARGEGDGLQDVRHCPNCGGELPAEIDVSARVHTSRKPGDFTMYDVVEAKAGAIYGDADYQEIGATEAHGQA